MIAKTILEQIGGRRFAAMTGSKDFTDMGNGLRMSLARNKTSANRLDIIYDGGADLYNMRFYRKTFTVFVWVKWNRFSRSSISSTVIPFSFHSTTKKLPPE